MFMAASLQKIEDILSQFPKGDASLLISVLQAIQDTYGWLSERSIYAVSQYLGLPASKIYGVATFYAQFRLRPLGRHVIAVCRGTACHVKGSERLLPILEQELKCKVGETTKDNKFTLKVVNCLGACSLSPVVNIDNDFYGNVKSGDIKRILRKYE
jgi:NADH-quinone oxidoreductase subunit E